MIKKITLIMVFTFLFVSSLHSKAPPLGTGSLVPTNIMIMLDNSGSMAWDLGGNELVLNFDGPEGLFHSSHRPCQWTGKFDDSYCQYDVTFNSTNEAAEGACTSGGWSFIFESPPEDCDMTVYSYYCCPLKEISRDPPHKALVLEPGYCCCLDEIEFDIELYNNQQTLNFEWPEMSGVCTVNTGEMQGFGHTCHLRPGGLPDDPNHGLGMQGQIVTTTPTPTP